MESLRTIPFNVPPHVGTELDYVAEAVRVNRKISGDGPFTRKDSEFLQRQTGAQKVLLTTSGTSALEMAALLCDLQPGDEVILPSYTFSTTATAFILAGASLVFVDIRPDTLNIDERLIEDAITDKARVIVAMHYAGVACDMEAICAIAARHGLKVVEDAAQGVSSTYRGRALGTIGDFGCYSFHETKNYSMGEGGALLIRDEAFNLKAEMLREKGTDRSQFMRGEIDKYTWRTYGSSYLPSDMNAAYLWGQLEAMDQIFASRMSVWDRYHAAFTPLAEAGLVEVPFIPDDCSHNAHMYYLKCEDMDERSRLIGHLKRHGVHAVFHYIPLHSAPAGLKYGRFHGIDRYTTSESERLVRLPLYFGMEDGAVDRVIAAVQSFFVA